MTTTTPAEFLFALIGIFVIIPVLIGWIIAEAIETLKFLRLSMAERRAEIDADWGTF